MNPVLELIKNLAEFYQANVEALLNLLQVAIAMLLGIGGVGAIFALVMAVLMVFGVAWMATWVLEKIGRLLWPINWFGKLLFVGVIIVYYLIVIALETAVIRLGVPKDFTVWIPIIMVVGLNAIAVWWHARNTGFWPGWVLYVFSAKYRAEQKKINTARKAAEAIEEARKQRLALSTQDEVITADAHIFPDEELKGAKRSVAQHTVVRTWPTSNARVLEVEYDTLGQTVHGYMRIRNFAVRPVVVPPAPLPTTA
jgi:hypothetical protein